MRNSFKFIISVFACEAVGLLSVPLTATSIQTWYSTLNKPSFSPPNWVFGPVWIVLYFMMGVSFYLIWIRSFKNNNVKVALRYFLLQLFLNFLWTILFFGFHSPLLALADIIFLWLLIVMTIAKFNKISKQAAYLLVPCLFWVSFAAILNTSIVFLNP